MVNEIDCTKFVGLYIDKSLAWDDHIDNVGRKISNGTFILRQIKISMFHR